MLQIIDTKSEIISGFFPKVISDIISRYSMNLVAKIRKYNVPTDMRDMKTFEWGDIIMIDKTKSIWDGIKLYIINKFNMINNFRVLENEVPLDYWGKDNNWIDIRISVLCLDGKVMTIRDQLKENLKFDFLEPFKRKITSTKFEKDNIQYILTPIALKVDFVDEWKDNFNRIDFLCIRTDKDWIDSPHLFMHC